MRFACEISADIFLLSAGQLAGSGSLNSHALGVKSSQKILDSL